MLYEVITPPDAADIIKSLPQVKHVVAIEANTFEIEFV